MLTRCPACQTVFRVSPEQLGARQGRVRCGHCLNAFDALHNGVEDTLRGNDDAPADAAPTDTTAAPAGQPPSAPSLERMASPPAVPPEAEQAPLGVGLDFELELELDEDDAGAPPTEEDQPPANVTLPAVVHTRANPIGPACPTRLLDEWEAAEARDESSDDVPGATPVGVAPGSGETPATDQPHAARTMEPAGEAVPAAPLSESGAGPASAAAILTRDSSDADDDGPLAASIPVGPPRPGKTVETPASRRRTLGIALGGLVACLLVQGVFLLRQPLSQAFPGLRGPLVALCEHLGCTLPLPREVGEISIEATDLHPEPGGQGNFVLHATLRNRAAFPQAYPYVELSLTDAADKPLVRRVFSPEEWAPGVPPTEGFAAKGTAVVVLPFSATGVAAVGYRVYAFYP